MAQRLDDGGWNLLDFQSVGGVRRSLTSLLPGRDRSLRFRGSDLIEGVEYPVANKERGFGIKLCRERNDRPRIANLPERFGHPLPAVSGDLESGDERLYGLDRFSVPKASHK